MTITDNALLADPDFLVPSKQRLECVDDLEIYRCCTKPDCNHKKLKETPKGLQCQACGKNYSVLAAGLFAKAKLVVVNVSCILHTGRDTIQAVDSGLTVPPIK